MRDNGKTRDPICGGYLIKAYLPRNPVAIQYTNKHLTSIIHIQTHHVLRNLNLNSDHKVDWFMNKFQHYNPNVLYSYRMNSVDVVHYYFAVQVEQ